MLKYKNSNNIAFGSLVSSHVILPKARNPRCPFYFIFFSLLAINLN